MKLKLVAVVVALLAGPAFGQAWAPDKVVEPEQRTPLTAEEQSRTRPDQQPHYIYDINTRRLITGPFKDRFECDAIGMRQLGHGPYRCATRP